ncbi:elongator complex protein 4-like isoform X2 [Gordionus sp. m RMFG-2023]|uniref:elongator complex protein 4-like isoform X2 n=1 Tax=Gordionus sp. m RMFG-2023 TaxID=3053472 RepID=UPI0031FE2413
MKNFNVFALKDIFKSISIGHEAIDNLIGGTPLGSIILIEEDYVTTHSDILLKYFIAQGIVDKHEILLTSADSDFHKFLEIPNNKEESDVLLHKNDDLDIAWRYKSLKAASDVSKYRDPNIISGKFDLQNIYTYAEIIENSFLKVYDVYNDRILDYLSGQQSNYDNFNYDKLDFYNCIISKIESFMKQDIILNSISDQPNSNSLLNDNKQQTAITLNKKSGVFRIALHSLGSPYYHMKSKSVDENYANLCQFIMKLKTFNTQDTKTCIIISLPIAQFENNATPSSVWLSRIESLCHTVIQLKPFEHSGNNTSQNSMLDQYHGIFSVKKISHLYALPYKVPPGKNDMAYKLKKKQFIIQKNFKVKFCVAVTQKKETRYRYCYL